MVVAFVSGLRVLLKEWRGFGLYVSVFNYLGLTYSWCFGWFVGGDLFSGCWCGIAVCWGRVVVFVGFTAVVGLLIVLCIYF